MKSADGGIKYIHIAMKCTLKMVKMVNFMLWIFYYNKKSTKIIVVLCISVFSNFFYNKYLIYIIK